MTFQFEVDRQFNARPGIYRSNVVIFRVWWLWFAFAAYRVRADQLSSGRYEWEGK